MAFEWNETPELDAAILAAQDDLAQVAKDIKGNYGYYASKSSMLQACVPALKKVGVRLKGKHITIDGKLHFYIKIVHIASKQSDISEWPLDVSPESKNVYQMRGAATTYGIRYMLESILGLACNDEDDGDGDKLTVPDKKPFVSTSPDPISEAQAGLYQKRIQLAPNKQALHEGILATYKITAIHQLAKKDFNDVLNLLPQQKGS